MGKHRKPESQLTRRSLLGMLVGGTAAAGVAVATSGRLYTVDELERELAQAPPATVTTSAQPTTTTVAPPTSQSIAPTTTQPPPTTTPPPVTAEPVEPSLPEQLAEQPRSGWGMQPAAAASAHLIALTFGVASGNVLGLGSRETKGSDHPLGLAADFMTANEKLNRAIGNFAIANRKLLRVKYVISLQHYNDGSGWSLMENRGSRTANHYDHCHVSFY